MEFDDSHPGEFRRWFVLALIVGIAAAVVGLGPMDNLTPALWTWGLCILLGLGIVFARRTRNIGLGLLAGGVVSAVGTMVTWYVTSLLSAIP